MKKEIGARADTRQTVTSFSNASSQTLSPDGKPMHSGAVVAQYVRCGKPSCRCARGELHGPYWYLFRRVGGRLKKTYLRPGQVEAARAACEEWRRFQARRLGARETMGLLRQMRQVLRDMRINY